MNASKRSVFALLVCGVTTPWLVWAAEQVWLDGNANNDWSTSEANWDAGAVWANGNSARFSAAVGEALDVNGAVSVLNLTFDGTDYEIGDATANATFTLSGSPSVVSAATGTNTISVPLVGSGGLTKSGSGTLLLTGADSPSTGNTVIQAGKVLWGANDVLPSGTVTVNSGAALEWTTPVSTNTNKRTITVAGSGVDGSGALICDAVYQSANLINSLTLSGDATVGNKRRIDIYNLTTSGYTFTKKGVGNCNLRSMPGSTMQKLVVEEGLAQFEGVDAIVTDGITVNTNAFMSVMANNNDRLLTADVTLNSGNLVANWYYPSATNTTVRFLNPITVNGDSALIIGVNSPVVLDENSGQANMNVEGPLIGSGNLTLNPSAGGLSNPGSYRLRLLTDNSGFTGTMTVDSGNVDVGNAGGTVGTLHSGPVTVNANGTLWLNRSDAQTVTNAFSGAGRTVVCYDGAVTFDGNVFSGGNLDVANGSLAVTNGATVSLSGSLTVATKARQLDDDTINAAFTIPEGCTLSAQSIVAGNDSGSATVSLQATINQTGGTVTTSGDAGEGNGLRLAHYPKGNNVYNMSGGTLTIGGGYDLGIATDGTGWFNLTGGDVYTTRVMLNERTGATGFGKLTVSGGTLHVGSGGITADTSAPYAVVFGPGGVLQATADFAMPVIAVLQGTDAQAAAFDPNGHTLTISGLLQGAGDLVQAGTGTLAVMSGVAHRGKTRVEAGTLQLSGSGSLLCSTDVQVGAGATLDIQVAGTVVDTATLSVADDSDPATGVTLAGGVAEKVGALVLGGVAQTSPGTYGSTASGADFMYDEYFSGTGVVLLDTGAFWDGTDTTANADGGNGLWDTATALWDDALTGGSAVTWSNVPAGQAIFGGAAGRVEVEGAVTVGGMGFTTGGYTVADTNGNATLTLAGAATLWVGAGLDATLGGQLTGSNGFVKMGSGRLKLSATNSPTLTGQVVVNEGTLWWGASNALPNTASSAQPIIVNAGATVDLGDLQHGDVSRHYAIAGTGVGGIGALVKTGAGSVMGGFATDSVTLMDDAAIGGASRFDIYGMNMNGHKLIKTGGNGIRMYQASNTSGGLDINQGTLYFENVNQVIEGTLTIASNMYLGVYLYNATPRSFTADIVLNGGRMYVGGQSEGIDGSWYGTVTVNGDGNILAGATEVGKYLPGASCNALVYSTVSGSGELYVNRASITPLSATNRFVNFYADNPFAGTVHMERGTCRLLGAGAFRFAPRIEVSGGVTVEIQNTGDTLNEAATLVVADDGNTATGLNLAAGVEEHVARLVLGGVTHGEGGGSYGSSASAAEHQDDEYFSGTGIIVLPRRRGTFLMMR